MKRRYTFSGEWKRLLTGGAAVGGIYAVIAILTGLSETVSGTGIPAVGTILGAALGCVYLVVNTLLLNILDLVFSFPMPIILALLLNEIRVKWFKRVSQTLLYLPHFLSWVVIGAVAYQMFATNSGVVNALIANAGHSPIPFLQEDAWWLFSYVLIGVWQSMGWGTIIYLAAITNVNAELYEAAKVDGANRWQQCIHVTLPCIRSTIVVMLIMQLGKLMGGSFERILALSNAKATEFTTTIPVLVYKWFQGNKFSESTALGLFQSVIGLILVLASDKFAKKMGEDGLL